jgi:hypothetical protein
MAAAVFGNRNYSGRYACHESDGEGASTEYNVIGGVTSAYVVNPNGMGLLQQW